ncbi:NUDIX domain-containing protein [Candidatus Microgenomates bacterium]|nr:NUDIX domain-containing protein [Candidatus Microgenomates bacterium]
MPLQQRHTSREFSAGGIVYKKKDSEVKWLVVQHSLHKRWIFPKGLIGDNVDGETKEQTALREVEEEGGIKARIALDKPFTTTYFYIFKGTRIFKTVYFYLMEYVSGDIKDHDFEVSEAKWLTEEEVLETLSFPADKKMFLEAKEFVKEKV